MASSAKHISVLLLVTLLSTLHVHARDSQFFNKVVTNNNAVKQTELPSKEEPAAVNPQVQEPNFLPESENGYGLYGHESGQLPPATTSTPTNGEPSKTTTTNVPYKKTESQEPLSKYLPKNYNPVAYVTVPEGEDTSEASLMDKSYTTNPTGNNNYYNGENSYYNNNQEQQQGFGETKFVDRGYTGGSTNRNNYYYNNGQQQQGLSSSSSNAAYTEKSYTTSPNKYNYYNGGNMNGVVQKQGMSDTRFLENGKYFYDINSEKYNSNMYENTRGVGLRNEYNNNRGNYYGNNENTFEYKKFSTEGYQNQDDFQDSQEDEDMP